MKRCIRCVLPETYPGIRFDAAGVCNYCAGYKKARLRPEAELRELLEANRNPKAQYDCVVGVSGGRDSSYALYYLSRVMGLRVLAYTADHGFVHPAARANARAVAQALGVELVEERHDHLRRCIRHSVDSWLRHPSPAMISMVCCGCRLGMYGGLLDCARERGISSVVLGIGNPIEIYTFKSAHFAENPLGRLVAGSGRPGLMATAGLIGEALANPSYFVSPATAVTYLRESFVFFYALGLPGALTAPDYQAKGKLLYPQQRVVYLGKYVGWDEQEMESVLTGQLGWQKPADRSSPWHFDCTVSLLRDYLYKELVGFTEVDDKLSMMVREGMISREEALRRLERQGSVPLEPIAQLCAEIGVDLERVQRVLSQAKQVRQD